MSFVSPCLRSYKLNIREKCARRNIDPIHKLNVGVSTWSDQVYAINPFYHVQAYHDL